MEMGRTTMHFKDPICNPKDYDRKGSSIVLTSYDRRKMVNVIDNRVCEESKRLRYIAGLAPEIRGMLRATQPTTIQNAILRAGILTDKAVSCGTLIKGNDKRKVVEESKTVRICLPQRQWSIRIDLSSTQERRYLRSLQDRASVFEDARNVWAAAEVCMTRLEIDKKEKLYSKVLQVEYCCKRCTIHGSCSQSERIMRYPAKIESDGKERGREFVFHGPYMGSISKKCENDDIGRSSQSELTDCTSLERHKMLHDLLISPGGQEKRRYMLQ
ncbi:hypothetical protein Tco_0545690 [Tanacetum coccineum]